MCYVLYLCFSQCPIFWHTLYKSWCIAMLPCGCHSFLPSMILHQQQGSQQQMYADRMELLVAGGWWLVGEVCKWSSFIYFIVCFQFVYRLVYSTIYISWVPIFFVKAIIRFFCGLVLQTTNSVDTRTNSQNKLGYYWFLAYWPIYITI